jgi:A/G-specific adenine glycosylase
VSGPQIGWLCTYSVPLTYRKPETKNPTTTATTSAAAMVRFPTAEHSTRPKCCGYPASMDGPPGIPAEAQRAILDWYAAVGRPLAFRRTADPYAVLVSEAIAQQTQAARAAERWEHFMARFPTVEDLAAATLAEVLREWQGLGYDRRAMNLWRAARIIVQEHGGRVPADVAVLGTLPGVGPYTARAVAAIAYGIPVGAVDTNVRRVLTRIVIGDDPAPTTRAMQTLADASVPGDAAAAWTHALMDIGATLCRAGRADCEPCPARSWCRSASSGPMAVGRRRVPARATGVARRPALPFPSTTRWLRGRVLDRLRAADGDAFVEIEAPIGSHDRAAVDRALDGLARDGLIELRADRTARLRME